MRIKLRRTQATELTPTDLPRDTQRLCDDVYWNKCVAPSRPPGWSLRYVHTTSNDKTRSKTAPIMPKNLTHH